MGFGQIGLRPLGGMIRMGMIEAHNLQSLAGRLPLHRDQLFRIDGIAVLGAVRTRVPALHNGFNDSIPVAKTSQQDATALEWIGMLPMTAKGIVFFFSDSQHRPRSLAFGPG